MFWVARQLKEVLLFPTLETLINEQTFKYVSKESYKNNKQ